MNTNSTKYKSTKTLSSHSLIDVMLALVFIGAVCLDSRGRCMSCLSSRGFNGPEGGSASCIQRWSAKKGAIQRLWSYDLTHNPPEAELAALRSRHGGFIPEDLFREILWNLCGFCILLWASLGFCMISVWTCPGQHQHQQVELRRTSKEPSKTQ